MDVRTLLRDYSEAICALAQPEQLSRPVPSCPAWTMGDLVFHVGAVHRFWAHAVAAQSTERPVVDEVDVDDDHLVEWFREQTTALLASIDLVGLASPCWTWWGNPMTTGAVARHQVHEAAVHLWDARVASSVPEPLDVDVALDGIDEFLYVEQGSMTLPSTHHISIVVDEQRHRWTVGDASLSDITVSANASDMLLVLHGRKDLDVVHVDGDAAVVRAWLDSFDLS